MTSPQVARKGTFRPRPGFDFSTTEPNRRRLCYMKAFMYGDWVVDRVENGKVLV